MLNLAETHALQGKYAPAVEEATQAIAIFDVAYGPGGLDAARVLSNRCEYLNPLGRFEEALASCREAIAAMRDSGEVELVMSYPLTGSGVALLGLNRPKEALDPLTSALGVREQSETPELAAETRFALARAIWESGGDRGRARATAQTARAESAKAANGAREVARIDAWLAEHPDRSARR